MDEGRSAAWLAHFGQAVGGIRDERNDDDRHAARGRCRVERTEPRYELGASKREAGAVRGDGRLIGGTLRGEIHDVIASDDHVVVLQTKRDGHGSPEGRLRGARPRYPIAQVIVTVAEPWYQTGASGPVAPGSAPPLELPDPTATPGWGAASVIG
jgi:hypothetical protein